ncbi:DNA-processing protein DprA [Candidatus Parcubacteria bacterium]|nr:DNA-processing protein DprA [Candidatus Parcubacteria bacterium]
MKKLKKKEFPEHLLQIPDPPDQLYLEGTLPPAGSKILCVVGSRKNTQYGRDVCEKLISSLRGKHVSIVSGLALGIDTIAHKAALAAGLHTLAVPGSGLDRKVIYPHSNRRFADTILESGGGLLSEFDPDFTSIQWAFPKRNRIMAAMSHAVLIIEAERKSGTLITARLASDYNKDVLVIPGSIFTKNSEGPHLLLRIGATPITSVEDLHEALGLGTLFDPANRADRYDDCGDQEKLILEILQDPQPRDELIRALDIPTHEANILLSLLEMKGHIKESLGQVRLT